MTTVDVSGTVGNGSAVVSDALIVTPGTSAGPSGNTVVLKAAAVVCNGGYDECVNAMLRDLSLHVPPSSQYLNVLISKEPTTGTAARTAVEMAVCKPSTSKAASFAITSAMSSVGGSVCTIA